MHRRDQREDLLRRREVEPLHHDQLPQQMLPPRISAPQKRDEKLIRVAKLHAPRRVDPHPRDAARTGTPTLQDAEKAGENLRAPERHGAAS